MIRRSVMLVALLAVIAASCGESQGDADSGGTADQTAVQGDVTETTEEPVTQSEGGFIAQDGDVVEVHYVGTLDDGSQFDSSRDRAQTFTFTVGTGQVISGFDQAVRGAKVGDVNTVRMEAADAYGEPTDEAIIEVPFNPEQGDVKVGDEVFLTNGQPAIVLEVTEETVTLDANHPLAGEALTFEIEVISITRG